MLWAAEEAAVQATDSMPAADEVFPFDAYSIMNTYDSDLVIIDVRTVGEFSQGALARALNIPLHTFAESLDQIPTGKSILIVCRTGGRARKAWEILHRAHPEKKDLWFLLGVPRYQADGSYEFY